MTQSSNLAAEVINYYLSLKWVEEFNTIRPIIPKNDVSPIYSQSSPKTLVIIINGCGESGKDTFENRFKSHYTSTATSYRDNYTYYFVNHVSSVDPLRDMANKLFELVHKRVPQKYETRKMISDLKRVWDENMDGSTSYIKHSIDTTRVYNSINFVHIREPENIKKIKSLYDGISDVLTLTILVKGLTNPEDFDNESDRNVLSYDYDITIDNTSSLANLDDIAKRFATIIHQYILHHS